MLRCVMLPTVCIRRYCFHEKVGSYRLVLVKKIILFILLTSKIQLGFEDFIFEQ